MHNITEFDFTSSMTIARWGDILFKHRPLPKHADRAHRTMPGSYSCSTFSHNKSNSIYATHTTYATDNRPWLFLRAALPGRPTPRTPRARPVHLQPHPPKPPRHCFFFGRNRYHVLLSSARTTHTTSQQPHTPSPPRLRRNLPTAFPQLSLVQTPRCFRSARNSSTHCARASMELTYTLTPYTFAHMRLHMSPTVPNNYIETLICSLEKKPRNGPNPPKLHTPRPGYTCFKLSAPHNNFSKKNSLHVIFHRNGNS